MHGWLIAHNAQIECLKNNKEQIEIRETYSLFMNLLKKFPKDDINDEFDGKHFFLEGYILNKDELQKAYGKESWQETFAISCKSIQSFRKLRGAFSGYIYDVEGEEYTVFTDHVGNHAVYYYYENGTFIASSKVEYIISVLKENGIKYHFNDKAAVYMLSYGFMLDDSTFVKEIKRVLPGRIVKLKEGIIHNHQYYSINNKPDYSISEQEAVEKIDWAFRNAVKREFEKDKEYGYNHLVDLSGGLDSRMVCWVAHEMGYVDQLNLTYCKNGYLDYKISSQVAGYLHHDYFFYPLDGLTWMKDIKENFLKNNGADIFINITGGNRVLKNLNHSLYGIEHTGMLGDVIISSYFNEEKVNYSKPTFGFNQYSDKISFEMDDKVLAEYLNLEQFTIATRGLLGVQSSYMLRQQYFETASPFMDADFMDACLALPFTYRKNHNIYFKWIKSKYPEAAEFGWESWHGVKPQNSYILQRKIVTAKKLIQKNILRLIGKKDKHSMNPIDFWYANNREIEKLYQEYYDSNIVSAIIQETLRENMKQMFLKGNVIEKCMVITTLTAIKEWF